MTEQELLARLLPHLARGGGDLLIGAGEDDCAAWLEPDGTCTVASCDCSVEHVHFDLARQDPEDVGWRALALALGDLAAKGAEPTFGLAAIAIPPHWGEGVVEGIYRGMAGLAGETGLRLVGGDTSSSPQTGAVSLTVLGRAAEPPLPRAAARPGWLVGVTGPLGGASPATNRPRPLIRRGVELNAAGLCCGDISDGLLREMDKFAAVSGAGADLDLDRVPVVDGVDPVAAIGNGEEVELVCVGPGPLPAGLHEVGRLTADGRVRVLDASGREVQVAYRGYDHAV